jgi:prevent-host-death family protein
MSERVWQLQDAKNRFSEVVDAALDGEPQIVTRRGKRAVVVLSGEAYDRVKTELESTKQSFVDFLLNAPKGEIPIRRVEVAGRRAKLTG